MKHFRGGPTFPLPQHSSGLILQLICRVWRFRANKHLRSVVAACHPSRAWSGWARRCSVVSLLAYGVSWVLFPAHRGRAQIFLFALFFPPFVSNKSHLWCNGALSPVCCWRSPGNELWMSLFDMNHREKMEKWMCLMREIRFEHDGK